MPVRRPGRLRMYPAAGIPVPGPAHRAARQLHLHLAERHEFRQRRPWRRGARPGRRRPVGGACRRARDRARHRLRGTPWRLNAEIPGPQVRRLLLPSAEALAPVSRAVDLGEISARAAHQVVRMAWTLADLDSTAQPGPPEFGQALAFHLGVAR